MPFRFVLPTVLLLCSVLLSGCLYSRITEKSLAAGKCYSYADCGTLAENVVYKQHGSFYVRPRIVDYEKKPAFFGLKCFQLDYDTVELICRSAEQSTRFGVVRVPQEIADYMTAGTVPAGTPVPELKNMEPWLGKIPASAEKIPVKRSLPSPTLVHVDGAGDMLSDAVLLSVQYKGARSAYRFLCPAAFVLDVPITILSSAAMDLWAFPGVLLMKIGSDLLGAERITGIEPDSDL